VQVYTPTSHYEDDVVEEKDHSIAEVMKTVRGNEHMLFLWDRNTVVDGRLDGINIRRHGVRKGKMGARDKLSSACKIDQLLQSQNSAITHDKRYTWKMPGECRKFRIDSILVKQRFRNQVKECESYEVRL
jgi:hypothetical protein